MPGDGVDEKEEKDDVGDLGPIPLFASEKNQQLDDLVRKKTRLVDQLQKDHIEVKSRVQIMTEHLRNVKQELRHTEALVDTRQKAIQTEKHIAQISEREIGRCQQQTISQREMHEEVQDRLNIVQNATFKSNEALDRFKLQMQWNQGTLESWALAAKQKEEDNMAMQKYTRADDAKIKEMTLVLEKLNQEVNECKQALNHEVTETQAKQIELDKTADEFRKLHKERQQLIQRWQETLHTMKQRDDEIARAGENYGQAVGRLEERRKELQSAMDLLVAQQKENKDVLSATAVQERIQQSHRERFQEEKQAKVEMEDQVEILQNELHKASRDLLGTRSKVTVQSSAVEKKTARLELARKRFQNINRMLDSNKIMSDKVESRAKGAEKFLEEKQGSHQLVVKQVAGLKEKMFKMGQQLFKERQTESNLIAEISGSQASLKNLVEKIKRLDQQALRQQELIYNAEFQIQQLERKVARASGVRTDDEKKVLHSKIAALKQELQVHQDEFQMLSNQRRKLDVELRNTERRRQTAQQQQKTLLDQIAELDLLSSSAALELAQIQEQRDAAMVEHDVMKLEGKRLKSILSAKADEVFGLENRRFQLRMSMEERKKEIRVHEEVQRSQLKVQEEARHKVALEFKEREMKVKALKAKFETLAKSMMSPDGSSNDGEERSQAYYVIKAAQMREELQRKGDELDSKIRTAEREISALEATLSHLVKRNVSFRSGFQAADLKSKLAEEMAALEDQSKVASDALFKKRKELQRVNNDSEDAYNRLQHVREQLSHLDQHLQHLQGASAMVSKDLEHEGSIHAGIKTKVLKLSSGHRRAMNVPADQATDDEKIMKMKAIQETNQNVLFTLKELSNEFPEMQSVLTAALRKQRLTIPDDRPPSRSSTGTASSAGSRSRARPTSGRSTGSGAAVAQKRFDMGM